MSIGDRVKSSRLKKGLTQSDLAKKLGYKSKTSVAHIENGRDIPRTMIVKLAEILDTTPSYLMGWDDEPSNISDIIVDNIYKIPVFESASAGFGSYASSEIVDYLPLIVKNPREVPETIAIVVSGDSMYPKIEDGDIVVVHKQDYVDSGAIAVVMKDNEDGLVKKIEYGKDYIELISINPMYPPQRFEREEMNRIRVVGLVKKIVKSL